MKTNLLPTTLGRSGAVALLGALLLAGTSTAQAASPAAVSNVRAAQRPGTKLVDIQYDLTYAGISRIFISILVSSNSGALWNVPASTFGGDYGLGITPGLGKRVVWDAGADWDGQYTANCRVRVLADCGWWVGDAPQANEWTAIAVSSDGTKVVACTYGGNNNGVFTSNDSGASWIRRRVGGFVGVASSADGTKEVALLNTSDTILTSSPVSSVILGSSTKKKLEMPVNAG